MTTDKFQFVNYFGPYLESINLDIMSDEMARNICYTYLYKTGEYKEQGIFVSYFSLLNIPEFVRIYEETEGGFYDAVEDSEIYAKYILPIIGAPHGVFVGYLNELTEAVAEKTKMSIERVSDSVKDETLYNIMQYFFRYVVNTRPDFVEPNLYLREQHLWAGYHQ